MVFHIIYTHMREYLPKILTVGLVLTAAVALMTPLQVTAQFTSFSIESVGEQLGLGDADLKETVLNIIRFVLGFMTLLAVTFIIYGGFMWLTAGGSEDRIDKAKKIISAAVIGLIIVLLAWAIVIFVAGTFANVTSDTYYYYPH